MKIHTGALATLSLLLASITLLPCPAAESTCNNVSVVDAQILIYLLPVAGQLRKKGMDIGWERQQALEEGKPDRYGFWVYNSRRVNSGSVTIGYYWVDRCTGVVREDETGNIVTGRVMERIRQIIISGQASSTLPGDKPPPITSPPRKKP